MNMDVVPPVGTGPAQTKAPALAHAAAGDSRQGNGGFDKVLRQQLNFADGSPPGSAEPSSAPAGNEPGPETAAPLGQLTSVADAPATLVDAIAAENPAADGEARPAQAELSAVEPPLGEGAISGGTVVQTAAETAIAEGSIVAHTTAVSTAGGTPGVTTPAVNTDVANTIAPAIGEDAMAAAKLSAANPVAVAVSAAVGAATGIPTRPAGSGLVTAQLPARGQVNRLAPASGLSAAMTAAAGARPRVAATATVAPAFTDSATALAAPATAASANPLAAPLSDKLKPRVPLGELFNANRGAMADAEIPTAALAEAGATESLAPAAAVRVPPAGISTLSVAPAATAAPTPTMTSDSPLDTPLALQRPGWGRALGEQLSWLVRNDTQQAELKLNPAHLGPLEVRLKLSSEQSIQQASVTFFAADGAVREALESALPRLRELLDSQGVQLTQAQVTEQPRDPRQNAHFGAGNADADRQQSDGEQDGDGDGFSGDQAAGRAAPRAGRGLVDHYV